MRLGLRVLWLLAALALATTACAKKTTNQGGGGGGRKKPGTGMVVCEVSDEGGFDDKSFNQTADLGVKDAVTKLGVTRIALQSNSAADYTPNVQACLGRNPDLIVTVGFNLANATKAAAKQNPDTNFAIVDFNSLGKNVEGLTFSTDQAAFLAGYVAAGMTKSGKVATFGGQNIPPVTIYENGFAAGILKFNRDHNKNVQLLGWDPAKQDGTFTGDFTNTDKGRNVTQQFISQGADIIFPVAGPVGLGAAAAVKAAGNVDMIWVDSDGCVQAAEFCNLFITSAEKRIDVAVFTAIRQVVDGNFNGGSDYVGTLQNDGVGLASFHDFDSKVPQSLKSEVDKLKKGIIAGSVSVDPKDYS